jgi:hypothetical protein
MGTHFNGLRFVRWYGVYMSGFNGSLPDVGKKQVAEVGAAALSDKGAEAALSMTVHSLPQVGMAAVDLSAASRWKMWLVLALCVAPVAASYFMYYVVRPDGRRNYGELITPQRPLPPLLAQGLDGQSVPLTSLKNQWLLMVVADGACDELCQKNLYIVRQLRQGLGKDKDRVDWVWLQTGDAPMSEAIKPGVSQALVLRVKESELAQWLQAEQGHALKNHVYVVDPIGNWMMRFPAEIDPAKARKDLDRLLKASAFWDKAGR